MQSSSDPRLSQYKVIRRNGAVVGFEPAKISIAMTKAFLAVNGGQGAGSARVRDEVGKLTDAVVAALMKRKPEGGAIHIEEIQDQVELALMRGGEHEVARAYVLYRERRSQERAQEKSQKARQARNGRDHRRRQRRVASRSTSSAHRARQGVLRGSCQRQRRADPQGNAQGPLQRRADGRGAQVRDPRRAHADREGPRLQLRHGAAACSIRCATKRSARKRRSTTWRRNTPNTSRASSSTA
jgi:hypothetical protein